MKPTKEEFEEWKKNRVTQWVFEEIDLMRKDYSDALGGGQILSQDPSQTAMKYAETVGFIDGLTAIARIEYKE